jgi:dihydroorotate dehydrogenase (fumarate)
MNLTIDYVGLKLANPFVIGASPMGDTFQVAYELQDLGASAVVMRSLFPEQMPSSVEWVTAAGESAAGRTADFPDYAEYQLSPENYLRQVECLKKMLTIPVIASLNGHRPTGWVEFAHRLENAGADAIELNFYQVVTDPCISADQLETDMLETVREIAGAVPIPVAVKLSPFHASVAQLAVALEAAGAAGVVVFNRFYQPDIDTKTVTVQPHLALSTSGELLLRLRWLAILSPLLRGTLVCSGGIHTPDDGVKALLAGAHAVQVVSALLKGGPGVLTMLLEGLESWMREHGHDSIDDFRGALNHQGCGDPAAFERANYIRVLQSRTI